MLWHDATFKNNWMDLLFQIKVDIDRIRIQPLTKTGLNLLILTLLFFALWSGCSILTRIRIWTENHLKTDPDPTKIPEPRHWLYVISSYLCVCVSHCWFHMMDGSVTWGPRAIMFTVILHHTVQIHCSTQRHSHILDRLQILHSLFKLV